MILTETAYAKLNLALHVRGKLADGRHRLETIFAFCEDGDLLEVKPADEIELTIDGLFAGQLAGDGDNLVLRAAVALRAAAELNAGASFRLTKNLPVASGIGGGSADAAAALRILTRMWKLDPGIAQHIAPELGSDVPACLLSTACRGSGAGELLDPVELGLAGKPVLLVNPLIPLSTSQVFANLDAVDGAALEDWRQGSNDLEGVASRLAPQIADVLEWLRAQEGAEFVRMSGSGATCFALFPHEMGRDQAANKVPTGWWHLATRLR